MKGTNTLRTALGNPKDKDPKANQTGVIYQYQCPHINCSSSYIGESGRSLGERIKEHLKAPSPIHLHSTISGHPLDPSQFNIMHKEVNSQSRTIKEAMFIHIQDPPSTGIWASTNCHIYGASSYIHHQCSSTNQHNSQQPQPTHNPPPGTLPPSPSTTTYLSCYPFRWGATYFFLLLLLLFLMVSTCVHPKHPPSLSTFRSTAVPSC